MMHIYVLYDVTNRRPVNPFKVAGFDYKYNSENHVVTIDEGKEKQTFVGCKMWKI